MRLNKIARKLGVSTQTVVNQLQKAGINITSNPNTKLNDDQIELLIKTWPEAQVLLNKKPQATPVQKESSSPLPTQSIPVKKEEPTSSTPSKERISLRQKLGLTRQAPQTLQVIKTLPIQPNAPKTKITTQRAQLTFTHKWQTTGKNNTPKKTGKPESRSKNPRQRTTTPFSGRTFSGKRRYPTTPHTEGKTKKRKKETVVTTESKPAPIAVTELITAQEFAFLMHTPIEQLLALCRDLGVEITTSQRLDKDLITLLAAELKKEIQLILIKQETAPTTEEDMRKAIRRNPVIVVMGHVNHGKTSLIDYLRKSNTVASEAGNITQHIGAYEITTRSKRKLTLLDTPGHQAFTAMRSRGAQVTDLAIIVIAVDDGVMPQTEEAINHAQLANVSMVFALNKIDKPNVDIDKVKHQLAERNITLEEWGGKFQCQPISAKKGNGVEELLEKVMLEADLLELKANPDKAAQGVVLESSLSQGRGYQVNLLVQEGTLHVGDHVLAGPWFGKVKAMFNAQKKKVKEAPPAMPIQILGINGAPEAGQQFIVVDSEQEARQKAKQYGDIMKSQTLRAHHGDPMENLRKRLAQHGQQELMVVINLIIKGDTHGSIEVLGDLLPSLSNEHATINVIAKGVGPVFESDVLLAINTQAKLIAFHTSVDPKARQLLKQEQHVTLTRFKVIYEVIEYVKELIKQSQEPTIKKVEIGQAEVVKIFTIARIGTIAGCIVKEGTIKRNGFIQVIRDRKTHYEGTIKQLKRDKNVISQAKVGSECGISISNFNDIVIGDIIKCFQEEVVTL